MVRLSKIVAVVNIFLAIVVLYIGYIHLKNYYEIYKPKDIASFTHLQIILPLIIYAIISITVSTLFLLKKKSGWWLLTIFTILACTSGIFTTYKIIKQPPSDFNLRNLMPVLSTGFYIISAIAHLSKSTRLYFKIYKNTD